LLLARSSARKEKSSGLNEACAVLVGIVCTLVGPDACVPRCLVDAGKRIVESSGLFVAENVHEGALDLGGVYGPHPSQHRGSLFGQHDLRPAAIACAWLAPQQAGGFNTVDEASQTAAADCDDARRELAGTQGSLG
jgi:hypothetical protein